VVSRPRLDCSAALRLALYALRFLNSHPSAIGIVIDENTALVLKGSQAEVIGAGIVSIIDPSKDHQKPTESFALVSRETSTGKTRFLSL
jgi:cyanophycinase-like exopeptidase